MKKYIKKEVIQHVPECISCDICGRSFDVFSDVMETQEFISIDTTGGYGSIFGDSNRIYIDICQHCFSEKLGEYIRIEESW